MVGVGIVAASVLFMGMQPSEHRARARLISEHAAVVPGTTAWLGLSFDIDKDWHLYWDGRNDTGMPVTIEPSFPAGYKVGTLQWPAPHRHVTDEFLDHVYENRVTILIPVEVPKDAKGTAEFKLHARWLVCKTVCLMDEGDVGVTVPVAADAGAAANEKVFAEARARVPKTLDAKNPQVLVSFEGGRVKVRSAAPAKGLAFYPGTDCAGLKDLPTQGQSETDTLELKLDKPEAGGRLVGVVEIEPQEKGRHIVYSIDAAIPAVGDSGKK